MKSSIESSKFNFIVQNQHDSCKRMNFDIIQSYNSIGLSKKQPIDQKLIQNCSQKRNSIIEKSFTFNSDIKNNEFQKRNRKTISSKMSLNKNLNRSVNSLMRIPQDFMELDINQQLNRANRNHQKVIKKFENEIEANKRYMNLVIHDLRNPSEAINQSLTNAQDIIMLHTNKVVKKLEKEFKQNLSLFKDNAVTSKQSQNSNKKIQSLPVNGMQINHNDAENYQQSRKILNGSHSSSSNCYSVQDKIIESNKKKNMQQFVDKFNIDQMLQEEHQNQSESISKSAPIDDQSIENYSKLIISSKIRANQINMVKQNQQNNNLSDSNKDVCCSSIIVESQIQKQKERDDKNQNKDENINQDCSNDSESGDQSNHQVSNDSDGPILRRKNNLNNESKFLRVRKHLSRSLKEQKFDESMAKDVQKDHQVIHSLKNKDEVKQQIQVFVDNLNQDINQDNQLRKDPQLDMHIEQGGSNFINNELYERLFENEFKLHIQIFDDLKQLNIQREEAVASLSIDSSQIIGNASRPVANNNESNSQQEKQDDIMEEYQDFDQEDVDEFQGNKVYLTNFDKKDLRYNIEQIPVIFGDNQFCRNNKKTHNTNKVEEDLLMHRKQQYQCEQNIDSRFQVIRYIQQDVKPESTTQGTQTQTTANNISDYEKQAQLVNQLLENDQLSSYLTNYKAISYVFSRLKVELEKQEGVSPQNNDIAQIGKMLDRVLKNYEQCNQQKLIRQQLVPQNNQDNIYLDLDHCINAQQSCQSRSASLFFNDGQKDRVHSADNEPRVEQSISQMSPQSKPTSEIMSLNFNDEISQSYCQSQKKESCQNCEVLRLLIDQQLYQISQLIKCNQMALNYIRIASASSNMIQNLIDDLLDLAKIQKGTFTLNFEECNLLKLIIEAFHTVQFKAEQKSIQLVLQVNEDSCSMFDKVFIDKRRMLQILLNFLSNGIKFTKQNGFIRIKLDVLEQQIVKKQLQQKYDLYLEDSQDLKIKRNKGNKVKQSTSHCFKSLDKKKLDFEKKVVWSKTDNNLNILHEVEKFIKIQMVIEDNGVGISDTNQIFKDYNCLKEHQKLNPKGTGLGLQICKSLIEQMAGNVYVESQLGKGTQFFIEMNLKAIERVSNQKIFQRHKVTSNGYLQSQEFKKYFRAVNDVNPESMQSSLVQNLNFQFKSLPEQGNVQINEDNSNVLEQLQIMLRNTKQLVDNNQLQDPKSFDNFHLDVRYRQKDQLVKSSGISFNDQEKPLRPKKRNTLFKLRSLMKSKQLSKQKKDLYAAGAKPQNLSCLPLQPHLQPISKQDLNHKINALVEQARAIQSQNKKKLLRVLVANDEPFQMIMITMTLLRENFIFHVDEAHNGQEALNFVKKNEVLKDDQNVKGQEKPFYINYYYDLILLDLNMPIMDGNEACQQIIKHYELINQGRVKKASNLFSIMQSRDQHDLIVQKVNAMDKNLNILQFKDTDDSLQESFGCLPIQSSFSQHLEDECKPGDLAPNWLKDLLEIHNLYDQVGLLQIDNDFKQDSGQDNSPLYIAGDHQKDKPQNEQMQQLIALKQKSQEKILKVFEATLQNVRYHALSNMNTPPIFALSATIDDQEILKTSQAGFYGFIHQPLSLDKIKQIRDEIINDFADAWISDFFQEQGLGDFIQYGQQKQNCQ